MDVRFILASRSPRRRELIQLLGYPYEAISADVDETQVTHADPATNVILTAQLKADAITSQLSIQPQERVLVIAADTAVSFADDMLGKPIDTSDARRMLRMLRGQNHEVHTGLVVQDVRTGRSIRDVHTAMVTMRHYRDEELEAYLATGDPLDKAGAYAIQHPEFRPVAELQGCFGGVMGLSICHLLQILAQFELPRKASLMAVGAMHARYFCPLYSTLS